MSTRRRVYSDAEKAAYYKRKAMMVANPRARKPRPVNSAKKRYPTSRKMNYPGVGRMIGSGLGSMAGNLIAPGAGGSVGGLIGGAVGGGAQQLIKRITGFGDYHVSRNSLVYNVDAVPEFSNDNERCTMICHREFIADIESSIAFNVNHYRINPTIVTSFPWLSSVARNWEQYVVQGMVFEFKTTSATAIGSTNTGLGTVVMATQYNSLAPEFTSKQQMENYEFSQSSVPSQSIIHPIECDPTQTQCGGIFNTWDPVYSSGDTRLYDIGKFSIATVGMQADASVIGELWVTYKICLLKPRLTTIGDTYDFFQLDSATVSNSQPLGNTVLAVAGTKNSGIVTLSGTQKVIISSSFVGLLSIEVAYQWDGANPHNITPPCVGSLSDSLSDVTGTFLGVSGGSVGAQNSLASVASAIIGKCSTATVYIQCAGGKNADGSDPNFVWTNMTETGITFNYCTLVAVSVNFQF